MKIIEKWFPIKSVGIEGQKEKTKAIGRIPSIHQYHARRPTCAARAIILASLLELPENDLEFKFFTDLIYHYGLRKPPTHIEVQGVTKPLKDEIRKVFKKQRLEPSNIITLDPFAGGGTFPLESQNLGLSTISTDLNPLAVLIQKATCEYPQEVGGKLIPILERSFTEVQHALERKMSPLYKNEVHPDANINYFVWVLETPCPECGLWIPMIRSFYLSRKYEWALIPRIPKKGSDTVTFTIGWPNTAKGYFKRGRLTCPRCQFALAKDQLTNLVTEKSHHRLVAIYEDISEEMSSARGRFRIPSEQELINSEINRDMVGAKIREKFGDIDLEFPQQVSAWGVQNYGITSVFKCFNGRQLLLNYSLLETIAEIGQNSRDEYDNNIVRAILLYLSFGLTKLVDYNSTLTVLHAAKNPKIGHTWSRPGLFMTGMYVEVNPLKENTTGGWLLYWDSLKRVLGNLIKQQVMKPKNIQIRQMDAMELDIPSSSIDYCFTDPPYYDNVPYAADSDFYYAWLKAILGFEFPALFLTQETPKVNEIVQDSFRHGSTKKAKKFYEESMASAFSEIHRVLKEEGTCVIVFAHKDMQAWETLLQAIYDSKLNIISTWPLMMEASTRQNIGHEGGVNLNSVVLLVCRKNERRGKEYFNENFRNTLRSRISVGLEDRWTLEFRGADFFLSALGPALQVFSEYEAVLDVKTDEPISLKQYLEFVDKVLVQFSLSKVLQSEKTGSDAQTQLYLVWRWAYGLGLLPYDEVWKFTHTLQLDDKKLEDVFIKRVRKKSKILYKCLDAVDKKERLLEKDYSPNSLIETLQQAGLFWAERDSRLKDAVQERVKTYGQDFWRVAQALVDLVPEAPETKLFAGLLRKFGMLKVTKLPEKKPAKPRQKVFTVEEGKAQYDPSTQSGKNGDEKA